MTRVTYRSALRAKGIKPLPANWQRATPKPGDLVLLRADRPAITVRVSP